MSSARPGAVTRVDPRPFLDQIAVLIRGADRPEIADVTVTDTWAVVVRYGDGAAAFVKICHTAPASAKTPERPGWPGPNVMPPKSPDRPAAAKTSMRVSYFAGWLRHLLADAQPPTAAMSSAEVGAVGHHWPLHGLKVTSGDAALWLAIVGTAPDDGFDPPLPEAFNHADVTGPPCPRPAPARCVVR